MVKARRVKEPVRMKACEMYAYGKINLGLDITGRREDGYHEVSMIMQSVRLHDTLMFIRTRSPKIVISTDARFVPCGEGNLIYKAIELVRSEYGLKDGVRVSLKKRLPVAAGMAGGSSDAAATIKAMNRLFDLNMSAERMAELGVRIGADVPYCLMGGTALAQGIGEKLTALPDMPKCHIVLVKPPIGISTPAAYKKYDEIETGIEHPDIEAMIGAIERKEYDGVCSLLGNVLQAVTEPENPVITEIREQMKKLGADGVLMSGSGPTVFGLFSEKRTAERAYYRFKGGEFSKGTFITEPYGQSGNRKKS